MNNPKESGRYLACVFEWVGTNKPKSPRWVIKNFIREYQKGGWIERWERENYRYDTGGYESLEVIEWKELPPLPTRYARQKK